MTPSLLDAPDRYPETVERLASLEEQLAALRVVMAQATKRHAESQQVVAERRQRREGGCL